MTSGIKARKKTFNSNFFFVKLYDNNDTEEARARIQLLIQYKYKYKKVVKPSIVTYFLEAKRRFSYLNEGVTGGDSSAVLLEEPNDLARDV